LSIGLNQQDSALTDGANALNVNLQYSGLTSGGNVNLANLYTRTTDSALLDSLTGINLNPELEGTSEVGSYTGINLGGQLRGDVVVQNVTGMDINTQLSQDAVVENFTGLRVNPQVNGSAALTNSLTAISVSPLSSVGSPVNGATGVSVDMSQINLDPAAKAAGAQEVALSVNDGSVSANYNYTVPSTVGFFQQHYMGGAAVVEAGSPVSAFGFGTNLAQSVNLADDWTLDGAGLGYVDVGFVGSLAFNTGTTMARWTGALGGAGNPSGAGTLVDAIMFRAAGILPQGGSLGVTNMYGFQVDPSLFCLVGSNCWGIFEDTSAAENHLSKLAIGTSSKKVANSSTALEIGNSKAFLNGRGSTTTKNALTAVEGMQFYDTTLQELQVYNGGAWVSFASSTPAYIGEIASVGAGEAVRSLDSSSTPRAMMGYGESATFSIPPDSVMYFNDIANASLFAFTKAVSSGTSGVVNILSGVASGGADSGAVNLFSGPVVSGSGDSGDVNIFTGSSAGGSQGSVNITANNINVFGKAVFQDGVQVETSGSQPTCDLSNRGLMWNIEGGTGVADIFQVCQKDASDNYVWVTK